MIQNIDNFKKQLINKEKEIEDCKKHQSKLQIKNENELKEKESEIINVKKEKNLLDNNVTSINDKLDQSEIKLYENKNKLNSLEYK